jgi:hypothetical protein
MEWLVILLLIVGVTVVMVAGFMGVSFGLGAYLYSREGFEARPTDSDPCTQCYAERDWYEGLPSWKQSAVAAWWGAKRLSCLLKGCR